MILVSEVFGTDNMKQLIIVIVNYLRTQHFKVIWNQVRKQKGERPLVPYSHSWRITRDKPFSEVG